MRLQGKVAIVTGGARGIGLGITRRFMEEGARVVVAQRTIDDVPEGAHAIRTDLREVEQIDSLVKQVTAQFGVIDVLVNNAGIMFEEPVTTMTESQWDDMLTVNLRAPFLLIKHVVPVMRRNGGGVIVNIGSIEGEAANPRHTAYCTTKAGIHGMTRALAVELGEDAIRVNAIAPGWIETDLVKEYIAGVPDKVGFERSMKQLHPVRRLGQIEDIGQVAVFLASDESAFVTGQVIVADGGRLTQISLPEALRDSD